MLKKIYKRLNNPVFILRAFFTLFAVNFAGFLFFAQINPLNLLNPLRFLDAPPSDKRTELTLFFPKDPFLYSLENAEGGTKKDIPMKDRVLRVSQKVYQMDEEDNNEATIQNAQYIIYELIHGPVEISANRLTREKHLIRKIWFSEGRLTIHLNTPVLEKMEKRKIPLLKYSIERSLYANLKNVKDVVFSDDSF